MLNNYSIVFTFMFFEIFFIYFKFFNYRIKHYKSFNKIIFKLIASVIYYQKLSFIVRKNR